MPAKRTPEERSAANRRTRDLRRLRRSLAQVEAPVVAGRNDAGNGPCPDCGALMAQGFGPCQRHQETE